MENWIISAASSNFYDNLMTSFIASLREVAGWTGNIGLMNYGLTPHQTWTLRNNGIEVIAPIMKYKAVIDDRFTTVGDFFKNRKALIAEWDLDIWFCKPVDDVFDLIPPNGLVATYDSTSQWFMTACVVPEFRDIVNKNISRGKLKGDKNRNFLQGGFIAGDNNSWYSFSGYQDTIIDLVIGYDAFGIDMIALNLYKNFYPDRVKVVGVEWNCLPEWTIKREGDEFYCRESKEPLRAIHVSSPNRRSIYMFETYYPDEFKLWSEKLK